MLLDSDNCATCISIHLQMFILMLLFNINEINMKLTYFVILYQTVLILVWLNSSVMVSVIVTIQIWPKWSGPKVVIIS